MFIFYINHTKTNSVVVELQRLKLTVWYRAAKFDTNLEDVKETVGPSCDEVLTFLNLSQAQMSELCQGNSYLIELNENNCFKVCVFEFNILTLL